MSALQLGVTPAVMLSAAKNPYRGRERLLRYGRDASLREKKPVLSTAKDATLSMTSDA